MPARKLNIVTALHCEAKPVIEKLRLKKIVQPELPFPVFTNKEKNIHLIIAGVGKIRAVAATTFLHVFTGSAAWNCFLNVGIAGAVQFSLGQAVLAHKIVENSTQRSWYPFISLLKNQQQGVLITHDVPQKNYPAIGMVDMEGSAFFQAANAFVSIEHIQVLKIISDGDESSLQQLNQERVKHLLTENLPTILLVIDYLLDLSGQEYLLQQPNVELTKFQSSWHFTQAQLLQLERYLRRWQLQIKEQNAWDFCQQETGAAQVIHKIIKKLDAHENYLC